MFKSNLSSLKCLSSDNLSIMKSVLNRKTHIPKQYIATVKRIIPIAMRIPIELPDEYPYPACIPELTDCGITIRASIRTEIPIILRTMVKSERGVIDYLIMYLPKSTNFYPFLWNQRWALIIQLSYNLLNFLQSQHH